jgi:IstB-like ATP binding protein
LTVFGNRGCREVSALRRLFAALSGSEPSGLLPALVGRGWLDGRPVLATSLDRLVHHSDVIAIEGASYRRREAEADRESRRRPKSAELWATIDRIVPATP